MLLTAASSVVVYTKLIIFVQVNSMSLQPAQGQENENPETTKTLFLERLVRNFLYGNISICNTRRTGVIRLSWNIRYIRYN